MQTLPSANPRCKNRPARPCLWMAVAIAWSTTACCSLSFAQSVNDFVAPADRDQPRLTDEAGAVLLQPNSIAVEKSIYQPESVAAHANVMPISAEMQATARELSEKVFYLASKWRTSLLQSSPTAEEAEVLAAPAASEPIAPVQDHYSAAPLSTVSVNIALPEGKLPSSAYAAASTSDSQIVDRRLTGGWAMYDYHWSATCMHHRPLYFEEINAERYGYTPSYFFQPTISAIRFFATIPMLPYKMAIEHPRDDCIYTLGHYRPGSCNPYRCHRLPLRLSAAAVEAGFIAGMILIFP